LTSSQQNVGKDIVSDPVNLVSSLVTVAALLVVHKKKVRCWLRRRLLDHSTKIFC
jgi:hypothetical protein